MMLLNMCIISSCGNNEKKEDNSLTSGDVPAAVQTAFTTKYPGAADVKWEKAKEDEKQTYKAKFKSADKEMKVEFGEDGAFIKEKEN